MDGNGRWATQRGLKRTEGHAAGEEALFDAVEGALELGIKWLTVYAFSTENWRRPADEVRYLMGFNESLLLRRRDELNDRGVRMRFIGRRDWRVPKRLIQRMDESIALTETNRTMTLTIAFNYGGRAEIVDAVRALVAEGAKPGQITEKAIRKPPLRPRDARPRPGGSAPRASTASPTSCCGSWPTASWCSPTCCGPTSAAQHLFEAVREYQRRDRRFGGLEDG